MRNQLRSIVREAVGRIPSDRAFLFAMQRLSAFGGGQLRIAQEDGLVLLDGHHFVPSVRRLPFYVRGLKYRSKKLAGEYLLDQVPLEPADVVIDCGANVGDLLMSIDERQVPVRYIAFEPGAAEFRCLERNTQRFALLHNIELHNKALAEKEGTADFYVSSGQADGSILEVVGATHKTQVATIRLDSLDIPRVKLLKLEAEGYEPEILAGAEGMLSRIQYITADVGFERGVRHESTLPQVTNFLLSRGFEVVGNGRDRLVLLFKNTYISK
jgi:FkbM family methyltransferase